MSRSLRFGVGLLLSVLLVSTSVGAEDTTKPSVESVGQASASGQSASDAAAEQRANDLRRVSSRLVCQCSCNMVLSECNHQSCPFATPERKRIVALQEEGKSDEEIVQLYVEDFGRGILSTPATGGGLIDRMAWLGPYIALVIGMVIASALARHYAGLRRLPSDSADVGVGRSATSSDDPYLARVERELTERPRGDRR